MNQIVFTYLLYLAVSVTLTVWVARKLHRNGRVFLVDVFHGNESLADSVSHLLAVGFYLINLGYVSLALKLGYDVSVSRLLTRAALCRSLRISAAPGREVLNLAKKNFAQESADRGVGRSGQQGRADQVVDSGDRAGDVRRARL